MDLEETSKSEESIENVAAVAFGLERLSELLRLLIGKEISDLQRRLYEKSKYQTPCTASCSKVFGNPKNWCKACEICKEELEKVCSRHYVRNRSGIWRQCDSARWPVSQWEIVKFFQPRVYEPWREKPVSELDLLTLLNVLTNHRRFSQVSRSAVLNVRQVRNYISHSPTNIINRERDQIFSHFAHLLEQPGIIDNPQTKECMKELEYIQAANFDVSDLSVTDRLMSIITRPNTLKERGSGYRSGRSTVLLNNSISWMWMWPVASCLIIIVYLLSFSRTFQQASNLAKTAIQIDFKLGDNVPWSKDDVTNVGFLVRVVLILNMAIMVVAMVAIMRRRIKLQEDCDCNVSHTSKMNPTDIKERRPTHTDCGVGVTTKPNAVSCEAVCVQQSLRRHITERKDGNTPLPTKPAVPTQCGKLSAESATTPKQEENAKLNLFVIMPIVINQVCTYVVLKCSSNSRDPRGGTNLPHSCRPSQAKMITRKPGSETKPIHCSSVADNKRGASNSSPKPQARVQPAKHTVTPLPMLPPSSEFLSMANETAIRNHSLLKDRHLEKYRIRRTGGIVDLANGIKISIPAKAFSHGEYKDILAGISFNEADKPILLNGQNLVSPVIAIAPHAAIFKKPVVLSIPHSATFATQEDAARRLSLLHSQTEIGMPPRWCKWDISSSGDPGMFAFMTKTHTFMVLNHFCLFAVVSNDTEESVLACPLKMMVYGEILCQGPKAFVCLTLTAASDKGLEVIETEFGQKKNCRLVCKQPFIIYETNKDVLVHFSNFNDSWKLKNNQSGAKVLGFQYLWRDQQPRICYYCERSNGSADLLLCQFEVKQMQDTRGYGDTAVLDIHMVMPDSDLPSDPDKPVPKAPIGPRQMVQSQSVTSSTLRENNSDDSGNSAPIGQELRLPPPLSDAPAVRHSRSADHGQARASESPVSTTDAQQGDDSTNYLGQAVSSGQFPSAEGNRVHIMPNRVGPRVVDLQENASLHANQTGTDLHVGYCLDDSTNRALAVQRIPAQSNLPFGRSFDTQKYVPNAAEYSVVQMKIFDRVQYILTMLMHKKPRPGHIPFSVVKRLSYLMDVEDPRGLDWRMLAEKIGHSHQIRYLQLQKGSPTEVLLHIWETEEKGVEGLKQILIEIGRMDAVAVLEKYMKYSE